MQCRGRGRVVNASLTMSRPRYPGLVVRVVVAVVARPRSSMRLRCWFEPAFALAPESPVAGWLREIHNWMQGSAGILVGRPVVLDLAAFAEQHGDRAPRSRDIRIMAIEGAPVKTGLPRIRQLSKRRTPIGVRPAGDVQCVNITASTPNRPRHTP